MTRRSETAQKMTERSASPRRRWAPAASKKLMRVPPTTERWPKELVVAQSGPAQITHGPSGNGAPLANELDQRLLLDALGDRGRTPRGRRRARRPPGPSTPGRWARDSQPMRSSSLRRPAAVSGLVDLRELEQTSSARPSPWCAGEVGRASARRAAPEPPASRAAGRTRSQRPAPTTLTCCIPHTPAKTSYFTSFHCRPKK